MLDVEVCQGVGWSLKVGNWEVFISELLVIEVCLPMLRR